MDLAVVRASEAPHAEAADQATWNRGLLVCVVSCVAFWAAVALLVVSA